MSATILTGLSQRFALIMDGLSRLAAARMAPRFPARPPLGLSLTRPSVPLLKLLYIRLRRLPARFAALAARVDADPGPRPRRRPAHSSAPAATAARPRPRPRLPTERGWVIRLLSNEGASFASQLQHLLADPDMAPLLATPGAGPLLRPLCHILAIPLPAALVAPPRQPKPPPLAAVPVAVAVAARADTGQDDATARVEPVIRDIPPAVRRWRWRFPRAAPA